MLTIYLSVCSEIAPIHQVKRIESGIFIWREVDGYFRKTRIAYVFSSLKLTEHLLKSIDQPAVAIFFLNLKCPLKLDQNWYWYNFIWNKDLSDSSWKENVHTNYLFYWIFPLISRTQNVYYRPGWTCWWVEGLGFQGWTLLWRSRQSHSTAGCVWCGYWQRTWKPSLHILSRRNSKRSGKNDFRVA